MTRGERVIAFIHRYCVVPEGKLVGKPLRLEEFQQRFINGGLNSLSVKPDKRLEPGGRYRVRITGANYLF